MRIVDKAGRHHWNESGSSETFERPEVDRGALRNLLIGSLDPERIRWNHKLSYVERAERGRYVLHFDPPPPPKPGLTPCQGSKPCIVAVSPCRVNACRYLIVGFAQVEGLSWLTIGKASERGEERR